MIAITVNKNQVFEREATKEEIEDYTPKKATKKPATKAKKAK